MLVLISANLYLDTIIIH